MARNLSPSESLIANLQKRADAEQERRRKADERAGLPSLPAPDDHSAEAARAIVARCDRADATPEDMAALRKMLDRRGRALGAEGGVMRQALARELHEMPATGLGRELLTRDLEQHRADLGFDTAPALERPLIDLVCLNLLRLGNVEQTYSVKWAAGGMSYEGARFWEARLTAAQRRYLAAVECLARVRRVRVELMKIAPDGSAEAVAVEGPGA